MSSVKGVRLWYPTRRTLALGAVLALVLLGLATAIAMAQAQPDQILQAPQPDASPDKTPALSVTKTVDPTTVKPGDSVTYTVVFSNHTPGAVAIDTITDVLPSHFDYEHLTGASSPTMTEPVDAVEPEIVWQGNFTVPATGTLTLSYQVEVGEEVEASETPYTNSVTAHYDGVVSPPAEAEVTVVGPDLGVNKTASPEEIQPGDTVTYSVVFDNDGNGESTIDLISDTLPPGFVFDGMSPDSDVTELPSGSSGTITWEGPFTVPAKSSLKLEYQARADSPTDSQATNRLMALADGEVTGPVSATVTVGPWLVFAPIVMRAWTYPTFEVTKEASAYEVVKGETVVYTVRFTNKGSGTGKLDEVRDTLPNGFTFLNMEAGSGAGNPTGTTGTLVWKGPFAVGGGQTLSLIYKVRVSDVVGLYDNSVTATTLVGLPPEGPASASVKVKEPYLLWEDFESGTDGWEPFLNYWRLNDQQWYLAAGEGWDNSYGLMHSYFMGVDDPNRGAHDALYMYEGPGAEEWTDYRLKALVRFDDGSQMGLWVRGKYVYDEVNDGKHVEGYYVTWNTKRSHDNVSLARLRTEGGTAYHFSDPELLATGDRNLDNHVWYNVEVVVDGDHIQVLIEDELIIDYYDSTFTEGTIGFFAYKMAFACWDNIFVTPVEH
jgi:uncharacterized repeat protein (TIGR01451 family)